MNGLYARALLLLTLTGASAFFSSCHTSRNTIQTASVQAGPKTPDFLGDLSFQGPSRSMSVSGRLTETTSYPKLNPSEGNSLQVKYSTLLQVLPEAIRNLPLYKFIDEWYGVPYQYGGNSKSGIDCSAFVQRVFEQVYGLNLLRTAMDQASMTSLIWNRDYCKEGDLVFFHTRGRNISHVGVYLLNNFFVHASTSQGIMISSLDESYWQKRFSCAGRLL